jgi:LytR cell envelope-related transcriptional attenuator
MSPNKKTALYFSPKKITVALITRSGKSTKVKIEKEVPWVRETLADTLLNIKSLFHGPFNVILDDELMFVFGIAIPSDTKEIRQFVRIKAAEEVPQELGAYGWAYKKMLESPDKKEMLLQFSLIENNFYNDLSKAVAKSGTRIEMIDPAALALARFFKDNPEPTLVIHKGEKTLVFATVGGLVFSTISFDTEPAADEIVKFLGFVKEKFAITPRSIFISGVFQKLNGKTPDFSGYKIELGTLDVFAANMMGRDGKNEGELNLSIAPSEEVERVETKLENKIIGVSGISKDAGTAPRYRLIGAAEENGTNPHKNALILFIFIASFFIIVANGIIWYQRIEIDKITKARTPLALPFRPAVAPLVSLPAATTSTGAPVHTPPLNVSGYSIEILNGNGEQGATQKLKDTLAAGGFHVVQTGNANNFNYTDTLLRYKSSVPREFRDAIEAQLSIRYTYQQGSELDSGAMVDMIIIVGKKIP